MARFKIALGALLFIFVSDAALAQRGSSRIQKNGAGTHARSKLEKLEKDSRRLVSELTKSLNGALLAFFRADIRAVQTGARRGRGRSPLARKIRNGPALIANGLEVLRERDQLADFLALMEQVRLEGSRKRADGERSEDIRNIVNGIIAKAFFLMSEAPVQSGNAGIDFVKLADALSGLLTFAEAPRGAAQTRAQMITTIEEAQRLDVTLGHAKEALVKDLIEVEANRRSNVESVEHYLAVGARATHGSLARASRGRWKFAENFDAFMEELTRCLL